MITEIELSNIATYPSTPEPPEKLSGLAKINFIFGTNGAGKSTIGREIATDSDAITWTETPPLQTLVYNVEFIRENFSARDTVNGVFTLGRAEIAEQQLLEKLVNERAQAADESRALSRTLATKQDEKSTLDSEFKETCWNSILRRDNRFAEAIKRLGTKKNFMERALSEYKLNSHPLLTLEDLEAQAEQIFSGDLTPIALVSQPNDQDLPSLEQPPELSAIIIGSGQSAVAGMISNLGNSDWVRSGIKYFKINHEAKCPFCQQQTPSNVAQAIADYFDDSFTKGVSAVADFKLRYKSKAEALLSSVLKLTDTTDRQLNTEQLKIHYQQLHEIIQSNYRLIDLKIEQPSNVVQLESTKQVCNEIEKIINAANLQISEHNRIVGSIDKEKNALTGRLWKYATQSELKVEIERYLSKAAGLTTAIEAITQKIADKTNEIDSKTSEINRIESSTTSIQPTLEAINKTLTEFGFTSFHLKESSEKNGYQLVRSDGSPALQTLSEGEKSFVTFLYFYHLIRKRSINHI